MTTRFFASTVAIAAAFFALAFLPACPAGPPTTLEGWIQAAPTLKHEKNLADAANKIRDLGSKALREKKDLKSQVQPLIGLLDADYVLRSPAAYLLGEIGDVSAAAPLMSAIDFSAAISDKNASKANGRIAQALGKLGDKQALHPLLKLTKSRNPVTALAAVSALGELGDKGAVEKLAELAEDPDIDPFISKNAIQALGKIGDPAALPTLIHTLFLERRGISFYRETSYAIFEIGSDSIPQLIDILDGKNKALMAWAEEHGVMVAGIYAKTAQILGDLSDRRAIPSLRRRLKFDDSFADMKLLPPMFSAEALGRLRAKEATREIAGLLSEEEANARGAYTRALVMIGDPRGATALAKSALDGQSYDAREEALWGYARLGLNKPLKTFDGIVKVNADLRTCASWFQGDKKAIEASCNKRIGKFSKRAAKHRPMVLAAAECKKDVNCYLGKLQDSSGKVRERAGWALSVAADPANLDALLAAVQDDNLEARFALINALDTSLFGANDRSPDKAAAQKTSDRLRSILAEEKGKAHTIKINEDLKRLALKVEHGLSK